MHYTHMKLYIYNRKGKWEEKSIHFAQRGGIRLGVALLFLFLLFFRQGRSQGEVTGGNKTVYKEPECKGCIFLQIQWNF